MKKWMLLTVLAALSLTITAQDDDLYFVPTKENVAKQKESYGMPKNTYYSGSQRSVDDYNKSIRSAVTPIDSTGNDIIDFSAVKGAYPAGSLAMSGVDDQLSSTADDGDFEYTKRLNRFDDYQLSEAYWDGYRDGRWSSPWYYSAWYDPWYDPWYTGYYGYYGPYYHSWVWYGNFYHHPWYYGHPYYVVHHLPSRTGPVSTGGYKGHSNGSQARSERRSTAPIRSFGQSSSNNRSFGSSARSNASYSSSTGSFGGGNNRSSSAGGGRSFGSRR